MVDKSHQNSLSTAKFTLGKLVSKYLILEVISYTCYVDEGIDFMFATNKSMRAIIVENQSALYKIFKRRKVINIGDNFWKLVSPRVISKNIIVHIKTEEDIQIVWDIKKMNKKMKVEGIVVPNKIIEGQKDALDVISPRFLKIDDFAFPQSIRQFPSSLKLLELSFKGTVGQELEEDIENDYKFNIDNLKISIASPLELEWCLNKFRVNKEMTCFVYDFNIMFPYLQFWDPNVKYNFIIGELSQQMLFDFEAFPMQNKRLFCYQNIFDRSFLLKINPLKSSVDLTDILNQDDCELEIFKREVYDGLLYLMQIDFERTYSIKKLTLRVITN